MSLSGQRDRWGYVCEAGPNPELKAKRVQLGEEGDGQGEDNEPKGLGFKMEMDKVRILAVGFRVYDGDGQGEDTCCRV